MLLRMLLTVDVGNTQTHFGVYDLERLVEHWRFATVRESTADELGAALRNLLELRGLQLDQLSASIVSSTVPELGPEWQQMAKRYLDHEMLVVGPGIKTGMALRYDNPHEIGADRLVNAVAAYSVVQGACVVIDFGTAVTCDVVDNDGAYLGGLIGPGIEVSLEALSRRAAKLPKIELGTPKSVIGKSTIDAIRSGIVYGFAGSIDSIIQRVWGELGCEGKAIATGGMAGLVVPFVQSIDSVDDLLTLQGLRLLYSYNR